MTPRAEDREIPVEQATRMFIGKTIQKMEIAGCNQIEFLFTDGEVAVLHIECDSTGLPDVLVCTHCAVVVQS